MKRPRGPRSVALTRRRAATTSPVGGTVWCPPGSKTNAKTMSLRLQDKPRRNREFNEPPPHCAESTHSPSPRFDNEEAKPLCASRSSYSSSAFPSPLCPPPRSGLARRLYPKSVGHSAGIDGGELALFLEMRKLEKQRNNLLLHNAGELDPPLGNLDRARRYALLTPPGTPLFPSLETESKRPPIGSTVTPKARPTVLKSRVS
ncbi:hypothetical protein B296_00033907 [Ensete ventricosum]|uniref:Uncharacterized protein n=1 Tax=Ensete ventricosum TaxID=4639 RepID=A0A426XA94_ENSVE|nr:hypothetical protein B296_00033907 [Ensete ventricosum]